MPSVLHSSGSQKNQSFNILSRDSTASPFWNSLIPNNPSKYLHIWNCCYCHRAFALALCTRNVLFLLMHRRPNTHFFNAKNPTCISKARSILVNPPGENSFHSPQGRYVPKIFGLPRLRCREDWTGAAETSVPSSLSHNFQASQFFSNA